MLLCEGDACPIKWFHFDCIGSYSVLHFPGFALTVMVSRCKSNATIYIHWKFVPSFCIYNIFIDINLIFRYDLTAMRRW